MRGQMTGVKKANCPLSIRQRGSLRLTKKARSTPGEGPDDETGMSQRRPTFTTINETNRPRWVDVVAPNPDCAPRRANPASAPENINSEKLAWSPAA